MNKDSHYGKLCIEHGLDPETTSIFLLRCKIRGLNPETTSNFVLACDLLDLDPMITSFVTLASRKHGSQIDLSIAELKSLYGEHWTMWACSFKASDLNAMLPISKI